MSDPDEYEAQIREGQAIVTDYIQKEKADYVRRINAMEWGRSSEDIGDRLYALVLRIGDKRHLIKFLEMDLADAPETIEIRRKLRQQVDEFFRAL